MIDDETSKQVEQASSSLDKLFPVASSISPISSPVCYVVDCRPLKDSTRKPLTILVYPICLDFSLASALPQEPCYYPKCNPSSSMQATHNTRWQC